jgi:hypothetical protein
MNDNLKKFFTISMSNNLLVNGYRAKREIEKLVKDCGLRNNDILEYLDKFLFYFEPYSCLDSSVRENLSSFSYFYYKEKAYISSYILKILARGPMFKIFQYLVKLGWKLKRRTNFVGRVLIFLGRNGLNLCNKAGTLFLIIFYFTPFYRAPFLNSLFRYYRCDPKELIENYIEKIPVCPHTSPVFRINTNYGCALIGLDLLPSGGELCFIESNFTPGHYMSRHNCFPDGDTLCWHLIDYAKDLNFNEVLVYPTNFQQHFKRSLEIEWKKIAYKNNISIEIIDDAYLGSPWKRRIGPMLKYDGDSSLYVIGRYIDSPLSNLVVRKGEMEEKIHVFNKNCAESEIIYLPNIIKNANDIYKNERLDKRFPNLIIKNKYIDQAKGIHLFKTDKIPEKAMDPKYIVSEYKVPDTIKNVVNGTEVEFVYLFRTYLLITPDGPIYLGARKDISGTPVPDFLGDGEIFDIAPYITNLNKSGDYCIGHSAEEDNKCEVATLKIGRFLHDYVMKKYAL